MRVSRMTTLPVVMYGCETWLLTLREERRLRVSENMLLRRIFEPNKGQAWGVGNGFSSFHY